jgi:hypothetical protein
MSRNRIAMLLMQFGVTCRNSYTLERLLTPVKEDGYFTHEFNSFRAHVTLLFDSPINFRHRLGTDRRWKSH